MIVPPASVAVAVRGSGPVGLAFALFLVRQGFDPAQIELDRDAPIPDALGTRALALGRGSLQLLARIARLRDAAPILEVEVSLRGHAGRTRIRAAEMGADSLGAVVRYRTLVQVLREACAGLPFAGTGALAGTAAVTVHAEGDPGDAGARREFDQAALLFDVVAERGSRGIARERFTDEGPLALLPLPEPGRCTVVWCSSPARARARRALGRERLAAELAAHVDPAAGPLAVCTDPVTVPLVRRTRSEVVRGREVWIGNAAQALHPVAGQGLNLGLRDAFELARCLGEAGARGDALDAALGRYALLRRSDRRASVALTDFLARIFTVAPLRPLQSVALAALDLAPAARSLLASRLMFGRR